MKSSRIMKYIKSFILLLTFCLISQTVLSVPPDREKAVELFKQYLNDMVQRVEKVEDPDHKRKILNSTLDRMLLTLEEVSSRKMDQQDREALQTLTRNLQEKKYELNGTKGFTRVPAKDLNNFANYIQQDLEQADTVTITISTTLLVIIILLLLFL